MSATSRDRGIRASVRRVAAHAGSLARLERELAQREMKKKAARLGAGAGLGVAAGIVAFFALAVGIATAVAALAIVLDTWLALLIVFGALLLLALVLAAVAASLFRRGTPVAPEAAIEEARLTRRVLRSRDG